MKEIGQIPKKNFCLLALLLILSVPWYWPKEVVRPFVFGFPAWVIASLGFSTLFAAGVAWTIHKHWKDADS